MHNAAVAGVEVMFHICPDEIQPIVAMWDHIRLVVSWCWCKVARR